MALGALGDHARQERLDAVDRSPQVDGHEPLPVGVAHFDGRSGDGDTGVVEQDVHRAVPFVGRVGEPIDVSARALTSQCTPSASNSLAAAASGPSSTSASTRWEPSAASSRARGEADARRSPGDHCHLAGQIFHRAPRG